MRALENAGREEEIIPLCLKEAEKTYSYERLVKRLRKAERTAEAEEWIRWGISATHKKWPGIAAALTRELLDIRCLRKDWLFVAAVRADEFFENPGLKAFEELQKTSEKAKAWPPVREAILHFLKTGKILEKHERTGLCQTRGLRSLLVHGEEIHPLQPS